MKSHLVIGLVVIFGIISIVNGDCNPLDNLNGETNPSCSATSPYCMSTAANTYSCVSCVSNCDCELDEFCSTNPDHPYTCQKFDVAGQDCRQLTQLQITNSSYPDSWKCAKTYTSGSILVLDQVGACIEGVCRYCDYGNGMSGLGQCEPLGGLKSERYCGYPGELIPGHTYYWSPGNYYQWPAHVWWAIFFCFFVIIVAQSVIVMVIKIKHRDGYTAIKG